MTLPWWAIWLLSLIAFYGLLTTPERLARTFRAYQNDRLKARLRYRRADLDDLIEDDRQVSAEHPAWEGVDPVAAHLSLAPEQRGPHSHRMAS